MPLDALPAKLVVRTRQQLHDAFLQWMLVRDPGLDQRPGGQPDQDANVWADAGSLIESQAVTISNGVTAALAGDDDLKTIWAPAAGTQALGAAPSAGAVGATTTATGALLVAGDVLVHPPTGQHFQVTVGGLYTSGQPIPIVSIDTGAATILQAGTLLAWQAPRPGVVSGTAVVLRQADGSGLSGGAPAETGNDLRKRIASIRANPPASGNDADYQQAIAKINGISVQQVFTYPAVLGPGTVGVTFTLRPATTGANRVPTSTQLAQALAAIGGGMPADDGIYMCTLVPSAVTVVLKATWATGSPGWADATPFPLYHASPNLVVAAFTASGVLSPTAFRLFSTSLTEVPLAGQSIGFFDLANQKWRRKKFLTVTTIDSTHYDVTVDPAVSDTSYTPGNLQPCCPWSDSLDSLTLPLLTYFDSLGPGEQYASFFDPGLRQKRSPPNPAKWPSQITNRLLGGTQTPQLPQGPQQNQPPVPTLFSTPTLYDVILVEPTVPYSTPVGVPGVASNLLVLTANLAVFPE